MSKPEAAPEMMNDGQRSILEWLQSNPPTAEVLEELEGLRQIAGLKLDGNAGFERDPKTGLHGGPFLAGFETLPPEIQEQWKKTQAANEYLYNLALASIGTAFEYRDNGLNVVDESLFTKKLLERTKREKLVIGQNPETGETAILTIIDGYLDPYEKEILECICKFKLDGRVTPGGQIYFTLNDLYRALRHGAGTISPQQEQKEALLEALNELVRPERRIAFKTNEYLREWTGIEGGKFPILKTFSELYGRKNRGQEVEVLILLDETPVITQLTERLNTWEQIPQAVKGIQQRRFTLEYKDGDKSRKRTFATNAQRRAFCLKNGITGDAITAHGETVKPWTLTAQRIGLRAVILSFVFEYIRARAAGKNCSDKKPYRMIFERCGISDNREEQKRAKADIAVILDHLVNTVPELRSWQTYTNKGSTKPDGVQISIAPLLTEGAK